MKMRLVLLVSISGLIAACKPATTEAGAATKETGGKAYPLDVCLVSGEKLGSMGEPVAIVKDGQQIKFCCEKCQPEFEKNPLKYLSKLPVKP